MEKIPTAEEFIKNDFTHRRIDIKHVEWLMIEFTKIHVEAALKEVYNKGIYDLSTWNGNPYTGEGSDGLDLDKILNAYPLTNIK